jgi:CheY-like chemotaxis protein
MTRSEPGGQRQGDPSADEAPLVAIVDDDASVRQSTCRPIRSFGYRAEAFASGEDFLASASAPRAACLLLDVRMPDMNGLEVQRRLAERGVRIPIVFLPAGPATTRSAVLGRPERSNFSASRSAKRRCCRSSRGSFRVSHVFDDMTQRRLNHDYDA